MSDFGGPVPPPHGSPPPPPPPPAPPYGAPAYGATGYGAPAYGVPSSFPMAPTTGHESGKAPRPAVPVGSWLLLIGAVAVGIGSFLTWYTIAGTAINGFDIDSDETTNGGGLIFMAIVLAGFAITGLFARRVLAVAILAVIFGAFTVLFVIGALSDGSDLKSLVDAVRQDFTWGPGLWVALGGSLVALAGSIVTLSKRRRWR